MLTTAVPRLGVNVDHVATVRNARGGVRPDPVAAARIAGEAGADSITMHLREDRRHIRDSDVERVMAEVALPLNLEMAATAEMVAIARARRPHAVCLVPEKREERTTEGGLDAAGQAQRLRDVVAALAEAGSRVSLFVEPDPRQLDAAVAVGAPVVELHTGTYCEAFAHARLDVCDRELAAIRAAARHGASIGLEIHAGHGLTYDDVGPIAALPEVRELNIGHVLVAEAVFVGLGEAVRTMKRVIREARTAARADPA